MIKSVKKITFHFVFQKRRNSQSKSFYILLNTYIDIEEGILNFKKCDFNQIRDDHLKFTLL